MNAQLHIYSTKNRGNASILYIIIQKMQLLTIFMSSPLLMYGYRTFPNYL